MRLWSGSASPCPSGMAPRSVPPASRGRRSSCRGAPIAASIAVSSSCGASAAADGCETSRGTNSSFMDSSCAFSSGVKHCCHASSPCACVPSATSWPRGARSREGSFDNFAVAASSSCLTPELASERMTEVPTSSPDLPGLLPLLHTCNGDLPRKSVARGSEPAPSRISTTSRCQKRRYSQSKLHREVDKVR